MQNRILMFFLIFTPFFALGSGDFEKVTSEIESVNNMRESLVSGVQGEVKVETFKAVCQPVGMRLKKFAKENSYKIRQVSHKYRNPKHIPNPEEEKILKSMVEDKELLSLWKMSSNGFHYYRRIEVKTACLNCHGNKNKRPDFVKKKYPEDKAFGFKAGDLRGIYSIFVPKK